MTKSDPVPDARIVAERVRRRIDPAAVPELIRELEAVGVGNEAWMLLDELAGHGRAAASAAPAVSRVLREAKDTWIRFCAARTLAEIGDPGPTVEFLIATLATPHAGGAAEALGRMGPRAASAAPALDAASRRTDMFAIDRSRAFRALCLVRPPDPEWLTSQLDPGNLTDEGTGPAEALVELGPAAVPATAKALATGTAATKTRAAAVLGKIRPVTAEAVAALAAALSDPEPDRRAEAAWALGALGPDAAAAGPDLLRAAREADSPDRAATFRDTARVVAPDTLAAASDPTRAVQLLGVWAGVVLLAVGWLLVRRRSRGSPTPRVAR
ncbi:MAG TPA: HEAT repeat domain-containing protein [Urbifossiella sp.]|nr:HEAT repeat domain-containing protein [Urbifossiella sp.]